MPFNVFKSNTYDENKPSLLFGDFVYRINSDNLFATRFIMNTAKILSKDFNVFMFSLSNNVKNAADVMEAYSELNYVFLDEKDIKFSIKSKDKGFLPKNRKLMKEIIERDLKDITAVKGIMMRPTVLFKSGPDNELFDCISNNPEELAISNKEVDVMNDLIIKTTMYSYSMFMTKHIRTLMDVFEYYIEKDGASVYQFVIDPAHYYKYFDMFHNGKTYYFEDDFRGNRALHKYPMGQLNYFYNFKVDNVPEFKDKKNLFIWGGVVLFHKGNRMEDWHTFLKDFNYERSVLHVAKGNAMKKQKNPKLPQALLEHPLFEETKTSIENHKLNEGILSNSEFEEKLKDYKYTFIQKCISKHDSLNFRIYYSLLYNMIPFIAYNYDLGGLQIPQKFKDRLIVTSSQDIMDKIAYFESYPKEAEKLLNELKDYYISEQYSSESYYYQVFKDLYFKEIYQK